MLGDNPHTGAGPWRTKSGGSGSPRQVEVYATQYGDVTSSHPSDHLRDDTSSGVLGPWATCTRRTAGSKGNTPLRRGRLPTKVSPASGRGLPVTSPSGRPSSGYHPRSGRPRPRIGSRAQDTRTCGSGHWGPGGQDHPGGDHVPQGMCNQSDDCHEEHRGGQRLDTRAPGVLPAPGHATKQYPTASPSWWPFWVSECRSTRPCTTNRGTTTSMHP